MHNECIQFLSASNDGKDILIDKKEAFQTQYSCTVCQKACTSGSVMSAFVSDAFSLKNWNPSMTMIFSDLNN